jgi:hypothetical protein
MNTRRKSAIGFEPTADAEPPEPINPDGSTPESADPAVPTTAADRGTPPLAADSRRLTAAAAHTNTAAPGPPEPPPDSHDANDPDTPATPTAVA